MIRAKEEYLVSPLWTTFQGRTMALAIGHAEKDTVVIDRMVELEPPVSPEQAVTTFVQTAQRYRLGGLTGDAYSAEWREASFKRQG